MTYKPMTYRDYLVRWQEAIKAGDRVVMTVPPTMPKWDAGDAYVLAPLPPEPTDSRWRDPYYMARYAPTPDHAIAERFVHDVQLKKGWRVEKCSCSNVGCFVVGYDAQCTYHEGTPHAHTVPLKVSFIVPTPLTATAIAHKLVDTIMAIEEHEWLEWVRMDGRPIFDPHRHELHGREMRYRLPV